MQHTSSSSLVSSAPLLLAPAPTPAAAPDFPSVDGASLPIASTVALAPTTSTGGSLELPRTPTEEGEAAAAAAAVLPSTTSAVFVFSCLHVSLCPPFFLQCFFWHALLQYHTRLHRPHRLNVGSPGPAAGLSQLAHTRLGITSASTMLLLSPGEEAPAAVAVDDEEAAAAEAVPSRNPQHTSISSSLVSPAPLLAPAPTPAVVVAGAGEAIAAPDDSSSAAANAFEDGSAG
jgi:hypothetical protein